MKGWRVLGAEPPTDHFSRHKSSTPIHLTQIAHMHKTHINLKSTPSYSASVFARFPLGVGIPTVFVLAL